MISSFQTNCTSAVSSVAWAELVSRAIPVDSGDKAHWKSTNLQQFYMGIVFSGNSTPFLKGKAEENLPADDVKEEALIHDPDF